MEALVFECVTECREAKRLEAASCWDVEGCPGGLTTALSANSSVGRGGRPLFDAREACEVARFEI